MALLTEAFNADGSQRNFQVAATILTENRYATPENRIILSESHVRVHYYYDEMDHAIPSSNWNLLGSNTILINEAPTAGYVVKITVSTDGEGLDDAPTNLSTLAANTNQLLSIANNIDAVTTLYSINNQLTSLYNDKVTLDSLYGDKATLDSLYNDKSKLDSLFADKAKLDSLFADKATLDSLYADKAVLDSIFADKATMDSLFADKLVLDSLYADKVKLDSIFADKSKLDSIFNDKIALDDIHNNLATILGAKLDAWNAEAEKLTADSYATEAEDVFVKLYSSDGDGTFTATDTTEYSALHWAAKSQSSSELDSIIANSVQLTGGVGSQGTLTWNNDEETLDLIQNGAVLQLGQEIQVSGKNTSGSIITNGTVCMATGTDGASGNIHIEPYTLVTDPRYIVGVATEDIANNDFGKVSTFGKVRGINTSIYNEGDTLYVSNNGELTNIEPTGSKIAIAFALNSKTNGTILVRTSNIDENRYALSSNIGTIADFEGGLI
jgi:hypothetical protein